MGLGLGAFDFLRQDLSFLGGDLWLLVDFELVVIGIVLADVQRLYFQWISVGSLNYTDDYVSFLRMEAEYSGISVSTAFNLAIILSRSLMLFSWRISTNACCYAMSLV